MALVRFIEVGRLKKTWAAAIPTDINGCLDGLAMIKSIKKHKALGSRDIDFGDDGGIYVGGFRLVGRFEVKAIDAATCGESG